MAAAKDIERLFALYRTMLLVRQAETALTKLFADGEVPGFIHLSVGQEAIAAGVTAALAPGDTLATTHRGHGHVLARGLALDGFFKEIMGRAGGVCQGRGGSMHVADTSLGILGANGIVGAGIPIALGSAIAQSVLGSGGLAVSFFGDGAMAEGVLHETLNMAALWKLPVLYVCENNLYGIGTRIDRSTAVIDQYKRVAAYNIPSAQEDGQDIEKVFKAAQKAVKHVRSGKGPYFLELMTYRYRGHSMSDSNAYRAKDEERMWSKRDPIIMLRDRLIEAGELTKEKYKAMDTEILDQIENEIIAFAESSPEPRVEEVGKYVLAENDPWVHGGVRGGVK